MRNVRQICNKTIQVSLVVIMNNQGEFESLWNLAFQDG